jgi:hypothetical protein
VNYPVCPTDEQSLFLKGLKIVATSQPKEGSMSQATADIVGTKAANFTFTISAATVTNAAFLLNNQPGASLPLSGNEVTIQKLAAGESWVQLDLVWATGDPNAVIDVGTVTSGTVNAANPKHTLDRGKTPGFVELFGI